MDSERQRLIQRARELNTSDLPVIELQERIREVCSPFNVPVIVRRLFSSVPEKYLKGLDCVVLTNEVALSRKDRKGKTWSRRRRVSKSHVLARYHYGSRTSLPYIEVR